MKIRTIAVSLLTLCSLALGQLVSPSSAYAEADTTTARYDSTIIKKYPNYRYHVIATLVSGGLLIGGALTIPRVASADLNIHRDSTVSAPGMPKPVSKTAEQAVNWQCSWISEYLKAARAHDTTRTGSVRTRQTVRLVSYTQGIKPTTANSLAPNGTSSRRQQTSGSTIFTPRRQCETDRAHPHASRSD